MAVGVVYDPVFASYWCEWDPTYVENPARYECVVRRCGELGLLERCTRVHPGPATRQDLLRCHHPDLLNTLEATADQEADRLREVSARFDCLYLHRNSWEAALLAAGAAVELVQAALAGTIQSGFSLARPPGHHATRGESGGYCYLNNVAVAARAALAAGTERVLIVDWDVHHGQGTQREFYSDSRVLYISIHRYEWGAWWPNLRESDYHNIGQEPAAITSTWRSHVLWLLVLCFAAKILLLCTKVDVCLPARMRG